MIYEFYVSIIFIVVVLLISTIIVTISDILIEEDYDINKTAVYECGFQPIDFNLQEFDIKFYVVGLLFLVFDVEIAFLLPLLNCGYSFTCYITFILLVFFNCFFITFLYEWKNKFLD